MDAAIVGRIFASAFLPSNPAPIVMSARGVAICATLFTVLSTITGKIDAKKSHDQSG